MVSRLTTPWLFAAICLLGSLSLAFSALSFMVSLLEGVGPWTLLEACCGSVLAQNSVAWLALAAAGVAGIYTLVRLSRSATRHLYAAGRLRSLETLAERRVLADRECLVIDHRDPIAFCGGVIHPQIFVSTGLIDALTPDELEAVVGHEAHHQRRRDPLRLALSRILSDGFFYLPVLRDLGDSFVERAEIRADEAAVLASTGGRRHLASALFKLHGKRGERGMVSISTPRLEGLAGGRSLWVPDREAAVTTFAGLAALLAGPVVSLELLTRTPVGFEALGLHVCLLVLIAAPLALAGAFAWTRPSFSL